MIGRYSTKYIKIGLLTIAFAILTINYDYFFAREFGIEPAFLIGVNILLLAYTIRFVRKQGFNRRISLLLSGLIIVISIYNLAILTLLSFGYGFTGRDTPPISVIGLMLDVLILVMAGLDFLNTLRYKMAK